MIFYKSGDIRSVTSLNFAGPKLGVHENEGSLTAGYLVFLYHFANCGMDPRDSLVVEWRGG